MEARNTLASYNPTQAQPGKPWVEKTSTLLTSSFNALQLSLGWLFSLGVTPSMTLSQKKNLELANGAAFCSLLLAFPGTLMVMLLGFGHPYSLMTSGVLVACLVLGLNGARKPVWSKALFAYSPVAFIAVFSLLELSGGEDVNSLLVMLSRQGLCFALLLPVLLYGYEDLRGGLRVTGIGVLVYLLYEIASVQMGVFGGQDFSGLSHGLFSVLSVFQYLALAGCILYMQSYTRQQELQAEQLGKKMQRLAVHDGLTGLYNHAFMDQMISDAINRSRRSHTPLSLLMLDVDYFKQINDTYGHNAGDETLKELVQILKANKRSTDYLGRWGGDELVMLLTDTTLPGASNLAEKLRNLVAEHAFPRCKQLTISLGASQFQEGDTPMALVERADAAMYRAKREGRNRCGV